MTEAYPTFSPGEASIMNGILDGMNAIQIAKAGLIAYGSVHATLERMEAKGFITRTNSISGKRGRPALVLTPTPLGRRVYNAYCDWQEAHIAAYLAEK